MDTIIDPGSTSKADIKFTSWIKIKAWGRYKIEKSKINPTLK